jgi:hypothetical protein
MAGNSACYVAYFCSGISTVKVSPLRGFALGAAAFPLESMQYRLHPTNQMITAIGKTRSRAALFRLRIECLWTE